MRGEDLSEEEIQLLLGEEEPEETIRMKCKDCGYEEDTPKWILDEMIEIHPGVKPSNGCVKCNGTMYIKQK